MNCFSTSEFKKLENLWYKKLKEEGFQDIEKKNVFEGTLHWCERSYGLYQDFKLKTPIEKPIVKYYREYKPFSREIKIKNALNYYKKAEYFLYHYPFSSPLEKDIWQEHTFGLSIREISKKFHLTNYRVFKTIKNLESKIESIKNESN